MLLHDSAMASPPKLMKNRQLMQARTTFIITWDKLNRMKGMSGERNRLKDKCVGFTLASGSEVATKWNTPHLTLTSSGCKTCEKHEK